jgi:chitinase
MFFQASNASAAPNQGPSKIWVTAYYPVFEQRWDYPPSEVDYTAFTHLIQFSILPLPDGRIDQASPTAVTPDISAAVVGPAHKAGDKVIIGIGGQHTGEALSLAIAGPTREIFVKNLVAFVQTRGYDGVDIDMEPIATSDIPNFEAFIRDLRAKLNSAKPGLLLTAAATAQNSDNPTMYASLQDNFDQINIMTYDLSGPWKDWKTWYNSPLYGDGTESMFRTIPYPSVTAVLQRYIDAGIPKSKLGIGISFYGDIWTGATGPAQSTEDVTTSQIDYNKIMDHYYTSTTYHWDNVAHAPYLSIISSSSTKDAFISYDDERLCSEKINYARKKGLGGVTLFEIGQAYRPNQTPGRRNDLLQAVKRAWRNQPLDMKPESR